MAYRAALLNFSKGCISPELEARFDLPAYQAALRQATNVKIKRTGGVSKRLGTRFVAEALGSTARLFPFQFSDNQAYALEFAQGTMRPYALGGAVLEEQLNVTAITRAATATITAAYHGYVVGDDVYLTLTEGMTEINNRSLRVLTVPSANTFTVNINTTAFGVFTGSGVGGITRVGPPAAPPAAPTVPSVLPPPSEPDPGTGSFGGYVGVPVGTEPTPYPTYSWKMPELNTAINY